MSGREQTNLVSFAASSAHITTSQVNLVRVGTNPVSKLTILMAVCETVKTGATCVWKVSAHQLQALRSTVSPNIAHHVST